MTSGSFSFSGCGKERCELSFDSDDYAVRPSLTILTGKWQGYRFEIFVGSQKVGLRYANCRAFRLSLRLDFHRVGNEKTGKLPDCFSSLHQTLLGAVAFPGQPHTG